MVKVADSGPQGSVSELVLDAEPYHAMDVDSVLKTLMAGITRDKEHGPRAREITAPNRKEPAT